jgi:uncharacterized protein (DUF2252 family)
MTTGVTTPAFGGPSGAAHPPTREESAAIGLAWRTTVPLEGLAELAGRDGRVDAVDLLLSQAKTRVPELVPLRHGRMAASPFAFLRGSALVMAADLAATPHTGLVAQLCGDAHVANFGLYGSPERRLLFDVNDFDETLPGPFEWDLKRLVASLEVAVRASGVKRKARHRIVRAAAGAYRRAMAGFAAMPMMDVWYAHIDADEALRDLPTRKLTADQRLTRDAVSKARHRDQLRSAEKLTTVVDGRREFIPDPPIVVPVADLLGDAAQGFELHMDALVREYARTMDPDRRHLVAQYRMVAMARKVVGVGSVGTRAWVLLMQGRTPDDLLILQAKEAEASVLERFVGASEYANHGERVVQGQRLMQAASDLMLGWQRAVGIDGADRDFYIRQLRDWKGSLPVEALDPAGVQTYGEICAWTLARAHARSGDRVAIAAYLGADDTADVALADFAAEYGDRTDSDHAELLRAIADGRVQAQSEE